METHHRHHADSEVGYWLVSYLSSILEIGMTYYNTLLLDLPKASLHCMLPALWDDSSIKSGNAILQGCQVVGLKPYA